MDDITTVIKGYCSKESSDEFRIECLNSILIKVPRELGLSDLILKHMGPFITHHDTFIRVKAVLLISELLKRLPELPLNEQQIFHLVSFFTSRISSDYDSIGPCYIALFSILDKHESRIQSPEKIVHSIVKAVLCEHHVPALSQSNRIIAYELCLLLMERPKYMNSVLTTVGIDFVTRFRDAMDGEKDPRCLRVCLRIIQLIFNDNFIPRPGKITNMILTQTLESSKAMEEDEDGDMDEEEDDDDAKGFDRPKKRGKDDVNASSTSATIEDIKARLNGKSPLEYAVEILFEVTAVYFPITFRPPPNDPYGITAEVLISSLNNVFAAAPEMCFLVVPMILEKLQLKHSETTLAKQEALRTLSVCAPAYGSKYLFSFLEPLRKTLVSIALESEEQVVADGALDCIKSISRVCSETYRDSNKKSHNEEMEVVDNHHGHSHAHGEHHHHGHSHASTPTTTSKNANAWDEFVSATISFCEIVIAESIDSMKGRQCGKIIGAIAASSATGLEYILEQSSVLQLVHKWCPKPSLVDPIIPTQRAATMELILLLIIAIDPSIHFPDAWNPIKKPFQDIFNNILLREIELYAAERGTEQMVINDEIEKKWSDIPVAITAISQLITLPSDPILEQQSIESVVSQLTKLALISEFTPESLITKEESDGSAVKSSSSVYLDALSQIGKKHGNLICSVSAPLFLNVFSQDMGNNSKWKLSLQAFSKLCSLSVVFSEVVPKIVAIAFSLFIGSDERLSLLKTIASIIESNKNDSKSMDSLCHDGSVARELLHKGMEASKNIFDEKSASDIELVSRILRLLTQNVSKEINEVLVKEAVDMFLTRAQEISASADKEQQSIYFGVITAIVGSARKEVPIPRISDCIEVFGTYHIETAPIFASIVNKHASGSELDKMIEVFMQKNSTELTSVEEADASKAERANKKQRLAVRALVWMTKSLWMRGHAAAKEYLDKLVSFLSSENSELASEASNGFGIIMGDNEQCLNKECFAREVILFRQKFFSSSFEIITNLDEFDKYPFRLSALVNVIKYAPKTLVLQDLSRVAPVLIQCLASDSQSSTAKTAALEGILIMTSEDTVNSSIPYLEKLVPLLLSHSVATTTLDPLGRATAIECIHNLTTLPYHTLHPYRKSVCKGLVQALDDPKRAVRRKAVLCREEWSVFSSSKTKL